MNVKKVEVNLLFSCFLGKRLGSKQIILEIITVGRVLMTVVTHTKFKNLLDDIPITEYNQCYDKEVSLWNI